MQRIWLLAGVLSIGLMAGGLFGDDKSPAPRGRGVLPPNWSKLGLTDEQKQHVYSVEARYRARIDELERQIKQVRKEERAALERVLTSAQRARLREILAEKGPSGDSDKEGSKSAPEKKP